MPIRRICAGIRSSRRGGICVGDLIISQIFREINICIVSEAMTSEVFNVEMTLQFQHKCFTLSEKKNPPPAVVILADFEWQIPAVWYPKNMQSGWYVASGPGCSAKVDLWWHLTLKQTASEYRYWLTKSESLPADWKQMVSWLLWSSEEQILQHGWIKNGTAICL